MMCIGGVASGVSDTISHGPAIVLGALASLIVVLALEWARPIVRAHGERAARRLRPDRPHRLPRPRSPDHARHPLPGPAVGRLARAHAARHPRRRHRARSSPDLWRQKDFPPALGLALVATAAILSCAAWAFYQPLLALGILMLAALIDMLLYSFMGDMLVCYRCGARHRRTTMDEQHPKFDLETAERYRQQDLRQSQASQR